MPISFLRLLAAEPRLWLERSSGDSSQKFFSRCREHENSLLTNRLNVILMTLRFPLPISRKCDRNNSGLLERDEFKAAMKMAGMLNGIKTSEVLCRASSLCCGNPCNCSYWLLVVSLAASCLMIYNIETTTPAQESHVQLS